MCFARPVYYNSMNVLLRLNDLLRQKIQKISAQNIIASDIYVVTIRNMLSSNYHKIG